MIPRGEVGLIFAEVGKTNKIFDADIYAAIVIVTAVTTILTPLGMRFFYTRWQEPVKENIPD